MTEARRIYHISNLTVDQVNFVLSQLADRLDELEGYRGKGEFKTIPASAEGASAATDLARYGDVISYADSAATAGAGAALSQVIVTIRCNTLKVYAQDSPTTILHGFGNVGPGAT